MLPTPWIWHYCSNRHPFCRPSTSRHTSAAKYGRQRRGFDRPNGQPLGQRKEQQILVPDDRMRSAGVERRPAPFEPARQLPAG